MSSGGVLITETKGATMTLFLDKSTRILVYYVNISTLIEWRRT